MEEKSTDQNTAYKVLALKYRPQRLRDLVGQAHVKQALSNAIKRNKIAHAFLFAGSRGTGKTTSARILAKSLNCLAFSEPTPEPCGKCQACLEIANSADMDVIEIDGASNNGVEQIRELRSTVENKPARDRYKVIIIDEVHMLSTAAFNALLKTLEEPPKHVKFVFATTDPQKIPETILSRCQYYDFRRLKSSEIVEHLQSLCEQEGIVPESGLLREVALLSEGGMRDAQSRLDQLVAFCGKELKLKDFYDVFGIVNRRGILNLIKAFRSGERSKVLFFVEELLSQGRDLQAFVAHLMQNFRDAFVIRSCGVDFKALELLPDEAELLQAEAQAWSEEKLLYGLDIIADLAGKLRQATSPRITLETTLLKLCFLQEFQPLPEILEGLQAAFEQGQAWPEAGKATQEGQKSGQPRNKTQGNNQAALELPGAVLAGHPQTKPQASGVEGSRDTSSDSKKSAQKKESWPQQGTQAQGNLLRDARQLVEDVFKQERG